MAENGSWQLTNRLAIERTGDIDHVDDDRFDTISLAFHFGDDAGHLVPVKRVINLSVNIILLLNANCYATSFSKIRLTYS